MPLMSTALGDQPQRAPANPPDHHLGPRRALSQPGTPVTKSFPCVATAVGAASGAITSYTEPLLQPEKPMFGPMPLTQTGVVHDLSALLRMRRTLARSRRLARERFVQAIGGEVSRQ